MFKCVLALALCISLASAYRYYEEECPDNEQFVERVNPCNTCAAKGAPCISICSSGCDCLPGHLRNHLGFCIPARFCERPQKPHPSTVDVELVEDKCDEVMCHRYCRPRSGICGGRSQQIMKLLGNVSYIVSPFFNTAIVSSLGCTLMVSSWG
ncbi:hypothetical protein NPIL_214971 [Nephila pilipes]|uniref:TIL domain-containing protein n=1 Tax=Nephila pilipes TaxID=299642 RepID=A0A8X6N9J2_NEPPI|nr:hypothetical protein NPIL_214971 [Nephila pilipes]